MFRTEGVLKFYDAGAAATGALSGAAAGAALGPWGAAAGGLIGGAIGFFQKKKGSDILKNNPRPAMSVPPEVLANQQIAQGAATEGMPSEQYQAAEKNIQRNQSAALASATERRGGVQNIGAIQQASDDATGQLNSESAQMRRQNIGQLLGANSQVASYRDKLFDWNQKQKYIQDYNYGMGLVGQGNQNIMSGADKLLGAATGALSSGAFSGGAGRQSPTRNAYTSEGTGLADTGGPGALNPQSVAARYPVINPNNYSQLIGG